MNKKQLFFTLVSALFLLGAFTSCKKVADLNNEGTVTSFEIVPGTISSGVELADPPVTIVSTEDSHIIYVNLHKGMHAGAISFRAAATINPEADRILNLELSDYIVFETHTQVIEFYVIAASGAPTKWELRLKFDELSDEAEILSFTIPTLPTGMKISQNPVPNNIESKISLYYISGNFPVSLYPRMDIGTASSDFKGSLEFKSLTQKNYINLVAQSGLVRPWTIELVKTTDLTKLETPPTNQELSKMALNYSNIHPVVVDTREPVSYSVDSLNGKVFLYTTMAMNNELIDLGISKREGVDIVGSQVVSFTQWQEERVIYVVSKELEAYRTWKIVSSYMSPSTIVLKDLTFNSTSGQGVSVLPNAIINRDTKVVEFQTSGTFGSVTLQGLQCVLNDGSSSNLPDQLTFNSLDQTYSFTLTSPDKTKQENWTLGLKNTVMNNEANLLDFELKTQAAWQELYIEQNKKQIVVLMNKNESVSFIPTFTVSKGATITSLNGTIRNKENSLCEIDKDNIIEITSEDGTVKNRWSVIFMYAPQVPNSDFKELKDPWSSANVTSPIKLIGTEIVDRDDAKGGKAVRCTTLNQNTLIWGYVVAAATGFTGKFVLNLSLEGLKYPRTMTKFGIPFSITNKPLSMNFDAKYVAGPKLQHSVYNGSEYVTSDVPGVDSAFVWAEYVNYNGDMSKYPDGYAGEGKNGKGQTVTDVKIVYRSQIKINGADDSFKTWKNDLVLPFKEYTENKSLPVTHVVIVMSSSIAGDIYRGAIDSKLWLANLKLIYYNPEAGAIVKKNN